MYKIIPIFIVASMLVVYTLALTQEAPQEALGAFGDPFVSVQLATSPVNGKCLLTDGTNNSWSDCASGSFSTSTTNYWAQNALQLGQISDVSTTSLATGYVLKWSGTEWESVATSTLGITAVGDGDFSTTSAIYFVNASTTIPKTYTANTFTGLQTTGNATSTLISGTSAWYTNFYGALTGNVTGTASGNDVLGQATSTLTSHTTTYNHANYDTAYGWGNHASAGYAPLVSPSFTTPTLGNASGTTLTMSGKSFLLGNVAIGTTTDPLASLHIDSGVTSDVDALFAEGTINNYYQLNIKNRSSGTGASTDLVATQDTGSELTGFINMGINSSGYTAGIVGNANDNYIYGSSTGNMLVGSPSTGKDLIFFTGNTNAYTNERMRILSTGNVGIGTTSPYTKLGVNGTVVAGNFVGTTTTPSTFVNASTTRHTNTGDTWIGTVKTGTWNGTAIAIAYGGTNSSITYLKNHQIVTFDGTRLVSSSSPQQAIVIATSTTASSSFAGGVGIGSTSPSVQFSVDGKAGAFWRIYNNAKLKMMEIVDGVVTLLGTWDFSGATVKTHTYPSLTYASSTPFVGTTTVAIGTARNAQAFNSVQCFTDANYTDVYITDGTNRMNWFKASTTIGTVTLNVNNTFTASEPRYIEFGNATNTKSISCSFDVTVNN